jgi:uncharacterized protein YaaN involved in tellurite resistance
MAGEILLDEKNKEIISEEERGLLRSLEEKVSFLLNKYQELKKERDQLIVSLDAEKTKLLRLEKRLDLLSQDREKVKTRIDQLLHRLRGVDI